MTVMLGPGEDRPKCWEDLITSHLTKNYQEVKYVKIHSHLMMGIYSLVLAKTQVSNLISKIKMMKVKTGFQGIAENKGSVIIRYLNLLKT
jgi:hypothetical protein